MNDKQAEATKMTWERLDNGDRQAQGEKGDFLLWKEGRLWKSRYRSKDHKTHFFLPKTRYLEEAKKICEKSIYWER